MRVNAYFVVGAAVVLLSLVTASGSVSLGHYQSYSQSRQISGSYLVYSPLFGGLALALAAAGIYLVYQSGRIQDSKTID